MKAILTVIVVMAVTGTALAQPAAPAPPSDDPPPSQPTLPAAAPPAADDTRPLAPPGATSPQPFAQPASPASSPEGKLSETKAIALSFCGTLAAWSVVFLGPATTADYNTQITVVRLGLLGTLIAPSLGHWYAHSFFTRGLGLRLLGGGLALFGAAEIAGSTLCVLTDGQCSGSPGVGVALALTGLVLYTAGTIDDIRTAPRDVLRYNEQHGLTIAPIIRTDRSDNRTFGLALTGQF